MAEALAAAVPPAARAGAARAPFALLLMAASGFAGLGYQIVWTQQGALWLGHEAAAVLAVVTAFFGGLGLGALALGGRIERSARPLAWYAGCEAAIGLWGLALGVLMAPASRALLALTGADPSPAWQWAVAFGGTLLLLLPATAAMGATLPALERVLRASAAARSGRLAALYAANTLGAVAGVLAAAFWLVPAFGLGRTALCCALLNAGCALLAVPLFAGAGRADPAEARAPASPAPGRALRWPLAATGALGIGYEVLVVRVLAELTESTVYTFAMALAVYLVGSAAGAAAYARWGAARRDVAAVRARLLRWLALACLAGTASLWAAPALKAALLQALGAGYAAALAAEAALAVAAFALPTFVMGALFSHLAGEAQAAGWGLGRAIGWNTLAAAAAPPLFGVLLLPALGPKGALLLVAAGYAALSLSEASGGASGGANGGADGRTPAAMLGGAALALALWAPPLAFVDVPDGGRLVSYREGALAAVSVVEDADGVARLRIDNHQQEGSSASRVADARQALLPLLLHTAPRHALFLGLGTGVTAASAAEDRALDVDAVELLPEVVEASTLFTRTFDGAGPGARLHRQVADARRFVRTSPRRYDLVVADNFHPARSGSGALYTVEHFEAVSARLAPGGLFVQWLPLHQLDLATLRSVVRSFVAAFPGAGAMLATNSLQTPVLGLVGTADGHRFDLDAVQRRIEQAALARPPAAYGLADAYAVLGSFVAGPQALARFAGDAPLNTDDRPVVSYLAPRATYAPEAAPRERLLALLRDLSVAPGELVGTAEPGSARRLAAYWQARDRFLETGRDVQPAADVRDMLAQVQAPLLDVLRTSPDFRPAYDPLLAMAGALAPLDAARARSLLDALARLQPARPEAARLLRQIGG